LYDSIDACIEHRNDFVHTGQMDLDFTEARLIATMQDFEAAMCCHAPSLMVHHATCAMGIAS